MRKRHRSKRTHPRQTLTAGIVVFAIVVATVFSSSGSRIFHEEGKDRTAASAAGSGGVSIGN
jgi:hypothetical protein